MLAQVVWTDTTTGTNLGQTVVVPTGTPGFSVATLLTAKLNAQVCYSIRSFAHRCLPQPRTLRCAHNHSLLELAGYHGVLAVPMMLCRLG